MLTPTPTRPAMESTAPSQPQAVLHQYLTLHWQLAELEPPAIAAALEILAEAKGPSLLVYSSERGEVALQFRTCLPEPSERPDLQHLAEVIEIEGAKARALNAAQIALIEKEIAILSACLAGLRQTDSGLEALAEYHELVEELAAERPTLSVKLNR